MPISSTGNRNRGVTLMELMVVLAIISLIVAISFPSTIAGLENVRLSSGARSLAAFMSVAANRAERREQAMELTVFVKENVVTMHAADASFQKKLELPQGIIVQTVWPPLPEAGDAPRSFLFLPGAAPPRVGIEIVNRHGARRIVRLNPVTGITEIERPEPE
ncbi:MAG TPA: prepilin-type N-terminal cleavage/methylation domain-containing protein [Bryobacteraceae bacterium]|nr:prepilin-type N-terminal cleavage/methylation domain-containing protein [Bryobacteraceae bacterium]